MWESWAILPALSNATNISQVRATSFSQRHYSKKILSLNKVNIGSALNQIIEYHISEYE